MRDECGGDDKNILLIEDGMGSHNGYGADQVISDCTSASCVLYIGIMRVCLILVGDERGGEVAARHV